MSSYATLPGHRRLFNLTRLLPDLLRGAVLDPARVTRELYLLERAEDVSRPDHILKLSIKGQTQAAPPRSLGGLAVRTLRALADELLEFRGKHLYVRRGKVLASADVCTWVSPLLLRMVALREHLGPLPSNPIQAAAFLRQRVHPTVPHSLVLVPYDPAIQQIVEERGLAEMHMHLNGTTECDEVWLQMLERRRAFVDEMRKAEKNNGASVGELLNLVEPGLTYDELPKRLRVARRLRWLMLEMVEQLSLSASGSTQHRSSCGCSERSSSTPALTQSVGRSSCLRSLNCPYASPRGWSQVQLNHLLSVEPTPLSEAYDNTRPISVSPVCYVGVKVPRTWTRIQHEAALLYQILDTLWELDSSSDGPVPAAVAPRPVGDNGARSGWELPTVSHLETRLDILGRLFFTYCLLWMGNGQALMVQRRDQVGFDQFQKFTHDGIREAAETQYAQRFHQLARCPEVAELRVIEGRFAPKDCPRKLRKLLGDILLGYDEFRGSRVNGRRISIGDRRCQRMDHREASIATAAQGFRPSMTSSSSAGAQSAADATQWCDLRLVAHFIKERDEEAEGWIKNERSKFCGPGHLEAPRRESQFSPPCRWHRLRKRIGKQLQHLLSLRLRWRDFHERWVGIDAASNELHTPPEVFAPVFRRARRAGVKGFTYHVGEDFHHLVSGLRAMEEAIDFLDLRTGDRLGHGTAAGISPRLWRERMPATVVLPRGEWLDDLVFAYHAFAAVGGHHAAAMKCLSEIGRVAPRVLRTRATVASRVRSVHPSPEILREAWSLRRLDATLLGALVCSPSFESSGANDSCQCLAAGRDGLGARTGRPTERVTHILQQAYKYSVSDVERHEGELLIAAAKEHPDAFDYFRYFHDATGWPDWHELEEVQMSFFSDEELVALQRYVLALVRDKGLVIEALPTSNLRISFYRDMREHHIFRWLGFHDSADRVPVVVGSDDPGIFHTCMRLEYEQLRQAARDEFGKSDAETLRMVDELVVDSHRYSFRKSAWTDPCGMYGSLL